ncbi:MAG: DUF3499 domain-containing protein [Actinobacteria bacterium]|nr:DUF3499 domain-containing protein [Actinomycetota bacterium]
MSSTNSSKPSSPPSAVGRRCTRSGCGAHAIKTLTYIYSDSTALIGPLSTYVEPHSYDLCKEHSAKLTVPQGWSVIEHNPDRQVVEPSPEDLIAIADAIRQSFSEEIKPRTITPEVGRRGHLRAIPDQK